MKSRARVYIRPVDGLLDEELNDTLRAARRHAPNRCPYCGQPCWGRNCNQHAHLARQEAVMRGDIPLDTRPEERLPLPKEAACSLTGRVSSGTRHETGVTRG